MTQKKIVASKVEIAEQVLWAEALKQIKPPLTDQQRKLLVDELFIQGFTKEEIETRARSVVAKDTYQTIAFNYWISDIVVLKTELQKMVHDTIEKNKRDLAKIGIDEREVWRRGLVEVAKIYETLLSELVQKKAAELTKTAKQMSAKIKSLDDDRKQLLWKRVSESLSLNYQDDHWREILPLTVGRAFEVVKQFFNEIERT